MKTNKSSGTNSLPTVVIKQITNDLSVILSKLFNLSFSTGVFPDSLKVSLTYI